MSNIREIASRTFTPSDHPRDDQGKFASSSGHDTAHYAALHQGLANERRRLSSAKSEKEKELRRVWIKQREKELELEGKRIGISEASESNMSDEELLAELMGESPKGKPIGKFLREFTPKKPRR